MAQTPVKPRPKVQNPNESPVNPMPPVVVALFFLIVGIEALFSLGAAGILGGAQALGWRIGALQDYGFSGEIFQWMWANNRWPSEHVMRFVTYGFVHGSFTHALFVSVMLLAMGKCVGQVLSQLATLVLFVAGLVAGAVAHGAMHGLLGWGSPWLVGGFPGVYALIGGFTYLIWVRLVATGSSGARAFGLIGALMAIRLVFGLLFGSDGTWLADLVGFGIGFGLSVLLVPGGLARLRQRLRRD